MDIHGLVSRQFGRVPAGRTLLAALPVPMRAALEVYRSQMSPWHSPIECFYAALWSAATYAYLGEAAEGRRRLEYTYQMGAAYLNNASTPSKMYYRHLGIASGLDAISPVVLHPRRIDPAEEQENLPPVLADKCIRPEPGSDSPI